MNILISFNDKYVQHAGVMLTSMFENNKQEMFNIYVLYVTLSKENMNTLTKLVERYCNKIHFLQVNIRNYNFPNLEHHYISVETYLRLFLGEELPACVKRIIYIDVDTCVVGSLQELWQENLEGKVIGAIEDSPLSERYTRLHIPVAGGYFNAGVQLIDVNKWREERFTEKSLKYLQEHPDRIVFHDQDILNVIAQDKWKRISFKWNLLISFYNFKPAVEPELKGELYQAMKDSRIVHFSGGVKPWMAWEKHPYHKSYYKYLALTPWRDYRPSLSSQWKAYKFPRNILSVTGLDRVIFGVYRYFNKRQQAIL